MKSWCSWRNQESDVLISKPEVVEYSNNESALQKIQSVETTPVPQTEEIELPTPETPAISTSDDVCAGIIANSNNNSDSTNESTTDNTSVVKPARPSYKSFVPSIVETFGDYESNKAKKQLMIEKAKNNNKQVENTDDNTVAVTPSPQSYKSFVPSIEEVFPRFKDIEEEENNLIQSDTDIKSQPPASPEPEATSTPKPKPEPKPEPTSTPELKTIETAPEPEAGKYAVIVAGYMAAQNIHEIKGDTMKATLSPDAERLTVQRAISNEVILSGYYSLSDGGWVIGSSKKFTEEEKKRITQLKELSSKRVQQPTAEKKGFEQ